jgi:hypothetical protein
MNKINEKLPIKIKYYGTYKFGLDSSIEINNNKYWVLDIEYNKKEGYTILIIGNRMQEATNLAN